MTTTKRLRHVYPSEQVAHVWAHPLSRDSQLLHARNPLGNIFFEGDSIYSYGHHFEIARWVENDRGEKAILFTTRTYSVTTAKHLCYVRRAIPNDVTVFSVSLADYSASSPSRYLDEYKDRIAETLDKASRARNYRLSLLNSAHSLMMEGNSFAEFFDLPERLSLPADYEARLAIAERMQQDIERRNEEKRAEQRRLWEERNAKAIAEAKVKLGAWIEGSNAVDDRFDSWLLNFAYLRVKPSDHSTIETTKGGRIPA